MNCWIIGYLDVTKDIVSILKSAITELLKKQKTICFYIGGKTAFDFAIKSMLQELQIDHFLRFRVVTALLPTRPVKNFSETDAEKIADKAVENFLIEHCSAALYCNAPEELLEKLRDKGIKLIYANEKGISF